MRRLFIAGVALVLSLTAAGCSPDRVATSPQPDPSTPATSGTPSAEPSSSELAWLETPLTDAVTGEQFKLSDFKGKPVLLHAFAAW